MADIQFSNNEIIIIGAGGLAREIVSWHNTSHNTNGRKIVGFLDDNLQALDGFKHDLKILGKINLDYVKKNQSVILAMADSVTKNILLGKLTELNIDIANFIHETCLIGQRTNYGKGFIMLPYAIVSCDNKIGDLVLINCGSQIGHDVTIGNNTSIMANVDIGGGAKIGNNVFIGSGAVILPSVNIPDNIRIGAGSVVIRSLKESGTYFGNPAKKIF